MAVPIISCSEQTDCLQSEEGADLSIEHQQHAQRGNEADADLEEAVGGHPVTRRGFAFVLDYLGPQLPADRPRHETQTAGLDKLPQACII